MTPDMMADFLIYVGLYGIFLFILAVGCIVADHVMPRIPAFQRFLDTLPDWEDED